jgi:hypothetical protein
VPRLIAATLREAGIPEGAVEVVVHEPAAIDRALGLAGPGDLVVICADQLERGWRQIEGFGAGPDARGDGAAAASASAAGSATAYARPVADAEAVRAHPRDEAPAEDPTPPPAPAAGRTVPAVPVDRGVAPHPGIPSAAPFVREARGVVLPREQDD